MNIPQPYKYAIIALVGVFVLWFIIAANLVPFFRNKETNIATFLAQEGQCAQALHVAANVPQQGYLKTYVQLQYHDVLTLCIDRLSASQQAELIDKALAFLGEYAETRPYYTRAWTSLAAYTHFLVARAEDPAQKQQLALRAETYLAKAQELSPNREEIIERFVRTSFLAGNRAQALERANNCLAFNPNNETCLWFKMLVEIYSGQRTSISLERDTPWRGFTGQDASLNQLLQAYLATENIAEAAKVYEQLVIHGAQNPQYAASAAFAHSQLGNYNKAVLYAVHFAKFSPQARQDAANFLRQIPYARLDQDHKELFNDFFAENT